jgi:hypothetical protein
MKNVFTLLALTFIITSCNERAFVIEPLKAGDKSLSCNDILLEINEADFHRKQAVEKKALGIESIVMPLGYIDTYMSADEAISAAEARMNYLNNIYNIKNCTRQNMSNLQQNFNE